MMNEKKRLSGKTWVKRLLSFVLALAMMVTLLPTSGLSVAKAEERIEASLQKIVFFTNNKGWSEVNAYTWDSSDKALNGNWPGTSMAYIGKNSYEEGIYVSKIPYNATGLIFNNGSEQTVNITDIKDGTGYYLSSKSEKWTCGTYEYAGFTVAGSNSNEEASIFNKAWTPSEMSNKMTWNSDAGLYEKTYSDVPKGSYRFKVTDGTWDNAWGNGTNDYIFETTGVCDVKISFDPVDKIITVQQIYSVTFNGTNMSSDGASTVVRETGYIAKLSAAAGYALPKNVIVEIDGADEITVTCATDGTVTIPSDKVTGNIKITAIGVAVYDVELKETNVTINGNETAKEDADYSAQITANQGYVLPESITVKVNGTDLVNGIGYTYEDGKVTIPAENIKGNLVIEAVGVKEIVETKTIYLNANGGGMWEQANAWFMAWAWKTGENGVGYKMTDEDDDGIYQADIPVTADNIIFLRKDPANAELNRNGVWNQTGELSVAGNYFTITAWGDSNNSNCSGEWAQETYVPSEPIYTVVGQSGLCGTDWSLTAAGNDMVEKTAGVYEKVYTNVKAGEYQFKVVLNHSWNRSWGDANDASKNAVVIVEKDGSTVAITFDATVKTISFNVIENYKVTFNGTNITSNGTSSVMEGDGYSATLQAKDGYKLPKKVVITVGDQQLIADDYSYDSTTGELRINADAITDDVTITAEAEQLGNITIYLNTGGSSLWDQAGAWFAAKVDGVWYKLVDKDLDGNYQVDIPENAKKITFYRNDPSKTAMEESSAWNYTNELDIAGNCYTITAWGNETAVCTGKWTTDASLDASTVFTLTVVGEAGLVGSAWNVTNTENDMTLNAESGLYEKTFTDIAAGTYKYKVAKNHAWTQSWGGTVDNDGNAAVTVAKTGSTVTITFDVIERKVNAIVEEPSTGGEGDEGDTPVSKSTYTVIFHFANTIGWSPLNLYVWNDDGATTGAWPGSAITAKDENGYHTMTVTYEAATNKGMNYIFNNGTAQTVDLSIAADAFDAENNTAELWVELNTTPNSEGKYVTKQVEDKVLDGVLLAVSPQITTEENVTSVTFEYVNISATSVEVRGTIPGASWDSGIQMTPNAKGIWTATVNNVDPGVYEYKFVVNGKDWYADPANGKANGDGNSVFTITDPDAKDENIVKINVFYNRADGIYVQKNADGNDTGTWNAYVWGDAVKAGRWDFAPDEKDLNSNGDKAEMVTTITVKGRKCQNVYLKPRMSTSTKDWLQEESQVSISVGDIVSGTINVYVVSDGTNGNKGNMKYSVVTDTDIVVGNKITDVQYDYDSNKIKVTALEALDPAELKWVAQDNSKVTDVSVSGTTYTLTLDTNLSLTNLYQYKIAYDQDAKGNDYVYDIGIDTVYASKKFADEFTYTGDDLGAIWSKASTTFKVWAPTAEEVKVNLYTSGTKDAKDLINSVTMNKDVNGTWVVIVDGDQNGVYYTYSVTVNGKTIEAVDPYARTTGVNGNRGMVIDLDSTDPDGWASDENPNPITSYTDAIIYELHVRDFSIDDSSDVSKANRGKFLAFTEKGTTTATGVSTGIDYLDDLGITHLHLLPIYDYASVDETTCNTFNWGYDPQNYNVPEGSYSTDPYNGAVRVNEMKQMVQALHNADISVIMDVVYNHVYNADTFSMNLIVPGYFSRVDSNTSGCGNDTASEREMVRKYIVESVLYWAKEYHIDGFRFDLVGLLDVETINQIVTEVHKYRPDIIFYGEGWDMDSTNREPGTEMAKQGNASKTPGFGYFSDDIRNLLGGSNGHSKGFASGETGKEGDVVKNFMAKPWWTNNPTQVIQYASCHDNYTLIDKIVLSTGRSAIDSNVIKMNNLAAAVYMTAQGVPFIHAGEEFLREKLDENGKRVENSYNASDFVNHIEWSDLENTTYAANSAYYKGLIAFRKAHPALSLDTAAEISARVFSQQAYDNLVSFWIDGNGVTGETHDSIYVIFNANATAKTVALPEGNWDVCVEGLQAGTETLRTVSGEVSVAGISAMVLVQAESTEYPAPVEPKVALPGSFNDWNQSRFMEDGDTEGIMTKTLYLAPGTYEFKIKVGDSWLGNSGTIQDTTTTTSSVGWEMSASIQDNCKLTATGGAYTFTFNKTSNMLIIAHVAEGQGVQDTSGIQDGVTLHAWNWSFAEIEANMAAIAQMGYTAIQTSPVQPLKEATNLSSNTVGGHWWLYYQPVNFVITTDEGNALGTKAELASMIETAHEYGVQVIVDVVANHLANKTTNNLSDAIPENIRGNSAYWHDITKDITNWNDRYNMTQYCMGGLPDLNTANADIQAMVLAFLKECVDIGVDGFRFDAAKSIETPKDDFAFASDFWPTVVNGVETYAKENYDGKDLYIYGEVLDNSAVAISAYTEYMAVTDNTWGNSLRNSVAGGTASMAADYHKNADASNLVLWAESHDTYADQSSAGVSEANINKTWALVAARADAMGLYLARPESLTQALGVASATGWDNPEVAAVNKFHNAFHGQDEKISNENGISYVERGTTGVVLVKVSNSASATVNVTAHAMAAGTYVDQITGNTFTVADGKITGTIGSTGIAVVYNIADTIAPQITGVEDGKTYYTTQKVVVTDDNLMEVTVNGTSVDFLEEILLAGHTGNTAVVYTVIATDAGNNQTTVTITMEPITAVEAPVKGTTQNNVTMDQKDELQAVIDHAEELLENDELTAEEKTALENMISAAKENLQVIKNVETAEEKITTLTTVTLPDPAKVEPGNDEEEQAIQTVVTAYKALSTREKELVDATLKAKLDALVAATTDYKIIEGHDQDWHEDSEHNLRFRANGHFSKFKGVRINGTPIDAKYYTAQAGSVILTLHADFLDTLPVGEYKLEVVYENNNTEYVADTTFDIKVTTGGAGGAEQGTPVPEQPAQPSQPSQPQQPDQSTNAPTGDNSPIMLYSAMALAALAVMAEAERRRRRA